MRGRHTTTFLLYQIGASQAGMPDKWRIEADYFEACDCDTVCSCIFLGNPDQGQCDLTSAWHIQGNSDRLPRYPQSHLDQGIVHAYHPRAHATPSASDCPILPSGI